MAIPERPSRKARLLLEDAARWRLLALLFLSPNRERQSELESLASELTELNPDPLLKGAAGFSEGEHLRLMGPGGIVSPREVAYRPMRDPGALLADLAAFYSAFGFSPSPENPSDHISCELDYLAFLRVKQAYALMGGQQSRSALAAEALDHFVADHTAAFAAAFHQKMAEHGPTWLAKAAEEVDTRLQWLRQVTPLTVGAHPDLTRHPL